MVAMPFSYVIKLSFLGLVLRWPGGAQLYSSSGFEYNSCMVKLTKAVFSWVGQRNDRACLEEVNGKQ